MVTVFSDKEQWLSNEIRLLWTIVSNDGRGSFIKIPDMLSDLEKPNNFLNVKLLTLYISSYDFRFDIFMVSYLQKFLIYIKHLAPLNFITFCFTYLLTYLLTCLLAY